MRQSLLSHLQRYFAIIFRISVCMPFHVAIFQFQVISCLEVIMEVEKLINIMSLLFHRIHP